MKIKEHTLDRFDICQKTYLEDAYIEGVEKGLEGDELFDYVEKTSIEKWNSTAF